MDQQGTPISEKKRLIWIDAARGFAIFGIFIVNIGSFSAPFFMYGGQQEAWQAPIDQLTLAVIDIFFQASFYTLFSILFGFGFQIIQDRLKLKNMEIFPVLLRRLTLLTGFGFIHAFLIWHGDILLSYGIIGFLLLLFLNVQKKTLLVWAFLLLGGSVGLLSLALFAVRDYLDIANGPAIQQAMENYQNSNLITIWTQNYRDWLVANGGIGFIFLITTLLPLFLIGMYIARKRWLHEPEKYKSLLLKWWIVSLLFFIGLKMGPYVFGNPTWFSYIQDNLGGTASALFYIISITLFAQTKLGENMLKSFSYVGKMALTNYITQSIISFVLFYGAGFGLYGQVRPLTGVIIVLIVFILQVLVSRWWLKRFLYGPLEWVWRCFTYLKKQPFRRAS